MSWMTRGFSSYLVKKSEDRPLIKHTLPDQSQMEAWLLREFNEDSDTWDEYLYEKISEIPSMPSQVEWSAITHVEIESFDCPDFFGYEDC